MLTLNEYTFLSESLDSDTGPIHRDDTLEQFAKFSLPEDSHNSIRAYYNDTMDNNNLRLIKFEHPTGSVEYHLHSYDTMPGEKSGHNSKIGFLHALKLIYSDAKDEVNNGKSIVLQTPFKDQFDRYMFIANKLAKRHNRTVEDIGQQPLTTAPFMTGHTIKIY